MPQIVKADHGKLGTLREASPRSTGWVAIQRSATRTGENPGAALPAIPQLLPGGGVDHLPLAQRRHRRPPRCVLIPVLHHHSHCPLP